MEGKQRRHFVLVHGSCHGAWCWFRLQPLLEAAGHRVTVFDLSASGIDPKCIDELRTFADYNLPLLRVMESIQPDEKVVLVGHSFGGMNIAFAMEKYPQKISVAVFVTAFMPDTIHRPSHVLEKLSSFESWLTEAHPAFYLLHKNLGLRQWGVVKYFEQTPSDYLLDTQMIPFGKPEDHLTAIFFGPKYMATRMYQLCSLEDFALARTLVRQSCLFMEDLSKRSPFSNEGFGSVKRAFVICADDQGLKEEFQRWQIKNTGVALVKEIKKADHVAMISNPQELCQYLLEIAN